jgi:hypothetical protein
LLSERPALRAALCELSSLASTAHITKGTAWTLGAGETLAATGRPLRRPVRTADTSHPARLTRACTGHTTNTARPARGADTSNPTNTAGPARAADTSNPTNTAGPAHAADTSDPANTAGPAHAADTPNTASSTGPAHTPNTAYPAGPAYPADTPYAGRWLHGATRHRHLRTARQSDRAVGSAREVCRPVAREVCLEPV